MRSMHNIIISVCLINLIIFILCCLSEFFRYKYLSLYYENNKLPKWLIIKNVPKNNSGHFNYLFGFTGGCGAFIGGNLGLSTPCIGGCFLSNLRCLKDFSPLLKSP